VQAFFGFAQFFFGFFAVGDVIRDGERGINFAARRPPMPATRKSFPAFIMPAPFSAIDCSDLDFFITATLKHYPLNSRRKEMKNRPEQTTKADDWSAGRPACNERESAKISPVIKPREIKLVRDNFLGFLV